MEVLNEDRNNRIVDRNIKIDVLKGIAIILVVIGHVISIMVTDVNNNIFYKIIYSFHMPLFMFLSGFLVLGREINLKKKFLSLVVPFLAWFCVWKFISIIFYKSNIDILFNIFSLINSPDNGLWFLWVLFLCFCILKFMTNISRKIEDKGLVATFIAIYFLLQTLPINNFGIEKVKWYFLFFGIGYFFAKYRSKIKIFPKNTISIICFVLFPICAFFWSNSGPPKFIESFNLMFGFRDFVIRFFNIITPLLGIGFVWNIVQKSGGKIYSLIGKLGFISMDIYVIHQSFIYGNNIIVAIFVALIISILVSILLNRFKITRNILYGRY